MPLRSHPNLQFPDSGATCKAPGAGYTQPLVSMAPERLEKDGQVTKYHRCFFLVAMEAYIDAGMVKPEQL